MSFATAGVYGASKHAAEGLGESFAMEMADFGVKVTLIEPAAYATDFMGGSVETTEPQPAYDTARARTGAFFEQMPPGDPAHTANAVLDLVDQSEPPLRLLLGAHVLQHVLTTYEKRMTSWRANQSTAIAAQ